MEEHRFHTSGCEGSSPSFTTNNFISAPNVKKNMLDLTKIEQSSGYPSMEELMEGETCPLCDGEYRVGDFVCWGMCFTCAKRNGLLAEFLS